MQVPIRKSEQLRKYGDTGGPVYLTVAGIARLRETLNALEKRDLPQAIADVQSTAQMGDFSENAAYQEAKGRLRRINGRIESLKDRLARAKPIEHRGGSAFVELGSTVVVRMGGQEKTYEIVGPAETNPSRGRISHLSPLGVALMGHRAGDTLSFANGDKKIECEIVEVR